MIFGLTSSSRSRRAGIAAIALSVLVVQGLGNATAGADTLDGTTGSFEFGSVVPKFMQGNPGEVPELQDNIVSPAIVGQDVTAPQAMRLTVASPALRRNVGVEILLPADRSVPRPTLYMLDGADAQESSSGWMRYEIAPEFFADKNVNVVMLNGGKSGMYTDWQNPDPNLGLLEWETFIMKELPPLIDVALKTNGVNAIAGTSMGAQAAMMLAHRYPGMYEAVAGFSGCYSTMDEWGRTSVQATVTGRGGDPANMWGELGGPEWVAHDSLLNAERLRGTEIYLSVANGVAGSNESLQTTGLLDRLVVGGSIEAVANMCTKAFDEKLQALDIAAIVDYEPNGTHSWGYWHDRFPKAWPTLSRALGL